MVFACAGSPNTDAPEVSEYKEVVCFIYHRFGDSRFPSTNISLKDFEAHLAYLKKNNYKVVTFSEAIRYLNSNQPTQKTAVLTIDDGYKSFFTNGLPLLKKYKMPATLFINTETVGGGDYMDWKELKLAAESAIEIGNHTHSHAYFLNEPEATRYTSFEKEIALSQKLINEHLNLSPTVFAYPYGEFDARMKAIVQQAGFVGAAAQNSGVIYNGSDIFQCPRFPMSEAYASIDQFTEKIKTHALQLTREEPKSFLVNGSTHPVLSLTFSTIGLQPERMQCFVQGSECKLSMESDADQSLQLTIQSASSIKSRRRTLYTLTIPDSTGAWHWYSHLWINPDIK